MERSDLYCGRIEIDKENQMRSPDLEFRLKILKMHTYILTLFGSHVNEIMQYRG